MTVNELSLSEGFPQEMALGTSRTAAQALVDILPGLMLWIDSQGRICDHILGQDLRGELTGEAGLAGRSVAELFSSRQVSLIRSRCKQIAQFEKKVVFDLQMQPAEKRYEFEVHLTRSDDDEFLMIMRDVTLRRTLENMSSRYEFIANTTKELLTLIDREYRYQAVNAAYCQAHGLSRTEIIGKPAAEIWGNETFETAIKPRLILSFQGQESSYSGWFQFSTLGRRYFEVNYYPYYLDGLVTHVVVVSRDCTARQRAEEKFLNYHNRLSILNEIVRKFLATQAPREIAEEALTQFRQLVPYTQAGIWIINPDTGEAFIVAQNVEGHVLPDSEMPLFGKDKGKQAAGEVYPVSAEKEGFSALENLMLKTGIKSYFSVPFVAKEKMIGAMILGSELTNAFNREHVELARQLGGQLALVFYNALLFDKVRSSQNQLRHLASRLVSAQEDERQRISLELHDQAGQALTALRMQVALLRNELDGNQAELDPRLEDISDLIDETTDLVRYLAHDLHPPGLDKVGLHRTIKASCDQFRQRTGLQIEYFGKELPDLPMQMQISLFRVFQEALTNIVKHASATQVTVHLNDRRNGVLLSVKDDGAGFVPQPPLALNPDRGIGLLGMKERMHTLGGNLYIRSRPGKGTTLVATVPR